MLFVKMNGLGNDYVFFDSRLNDPKDVSYLEKNIALLAPALSDRHFGIGSDGVVILYPDPGSDIKMRIFNADGSEGMTCGNALRCIGKYLRQSCPDKDRFAVLTEAGVRFLRLNGNGTVSADMGKADYRGCRSGAAFVNVGNPHGVIFGGDVSDTAFGKAEELSLTYDVNAELVSVENRNAFRMRVFERGSGETLACGSGAAAAAYALHLNGMITLPVRVILRGGELTVDMDKDGGMTVTGTAETNYTGEVDIYRYGKT